MAYRRVLRFDVESLIEDDSAAELTAPYCGFFFSTEQRTGPAGTHPPGLFLRSAAGRS
mgnify:CR=1 FL=1